MNKYLKKTKIIATLGPASSSKEVMMDLIKSGVAISSVAPNRMLAFDWGFFRNSLEITNPIRGDKPFVMTPEGFHQNFANTLSESESNEAYDRLVVHDSRNILRDCMLSSGHIDIERITVPLLFVAGEDDEIIPSDLCQKNAEAYDEAPNETAFKLFPNRSHFICGESGWEEVARAITEWLELTDHSSASLHNRILTAADKAFK